MAILDARHRRTAPLRRALLVPLLLATAAAAVADQAQPPTADDETFRRLAQQLGWAEAPADPGATTDPRLRTAWNLRRLLLGDIDEEAFYGELARTDMGGLEAREFLVRLKTEMLQRLGTVPAQHFFGEIYLQDQGAAAAAGAAAPPGSELEDRLLGWRRRATEQSIREAAAELRGTAGADGGRYSLYVYTLGSTPRGRGAEALPGDIDVNAVSADLDLAQRVVDRARARLETRLGGLSADSVDVVFTALGLAGPEVYAGEPGRIAALRLVVEGRAGPAFRVDLETGRLGEAVDARGALREVALEGGLRDVTVDELGELRLPSAGPAAVFEMARHLDRDVLRHLQFEDLDTFVKIAKFVQRADRHAAAAGHPLDGDLVRFANDLLAAKDAGDYVRAGTLAREFLGGSSPVDVQLGRTPYGMDAAVIQANQELLRRFGERARVELLGAGRRYLAAEIEALRGRMRLLEDGFEDPRAVAEAAARLSNDMEVERLVLGDARHGLSTPDPEVGRLVDDLATVRRRLLREHWQEVLPEDVRRQRAFVERMLEQGGDTNRQLALATVTSPPEGGIATALDMVDGVNGLLDSLDDHLLADLRGERDWALVLLDGHRTSYAERARTVLGLEILPDSAAAWAGRAEATVVGVENRLNPLFFDNFLARRVQRANQLFRESIKDSPTAVAGMKALTAIRLADELPAYWRAMETGGWSELATEFFRRRAPGGSSLEHLMMGNTALACCDLFKSIMPPAAMAQTAFSLGQELGRRSWDLWWSEELDLFIDQLYAGATWEVEGVERLGSGITLTRFRLATVTYRDHTVDVDTYLLVKRLQVRDMAAALEVPYGQRSFPWEHASDDPLLGWLAADDVLRPNLAHADLVLLLLDDLRSNPHAGFKLDDQLDQLWATRWEQVKVAFLAKVRDQLERRRGAEDFGVARLGEAVLELDRVTTELRVRDEVRAALEAEVGSEAGRFLRWLGDALADRAREAYELPSVEDAYEEATRVTLDYLAAYDRVLEARREAEPGFARDGLPAEDHGLRLLTTPFLLACRPDADAAAARAELTLPLETEVSVRDELGALKAELGAGGLDEGADSFDQRTVRGVTYHEVFTDLWRRVEVARSPLRGSVGATDFEVWWELWTSAQAGGEPVAAALDAARDRLTGADRTGELGGRDLPLERFRAHDAERDRLVGDFLVHHLLGGRLGELRGRADELRTAAAAACRTTTDELATARRDAATLAAAAAELDATLDGVGPRLDEAPRLEARAAEAAGAAGDGAAATGEAAHAAEAAALALCERLQAARGTSDPARRRALQGEAEGLLAGLRDEVARGEEAAAATGAAAGAASAAARELESLVDEVRQVAKAAADEAAVAPGEALERARAAVAEARARVTELAEVAQAVDELAAAARAAVERVAGPEDRAALLARVEPALAAARQAAQATAGCPEDAAAAVEAATAVVTEAEHAGAAARERAAALARALAEAEARREAAWDRVTAAEAAAELAAGWLERLHGAAADAEVCRGLLDELVGPAGGIVVPDVVGRPVEVARDLLAEAGLAVSLRGGAAAPSPERAYTIQAQEPPGGSPAAGVVTLTVYGEATAVRVPALAGLDAAGARAAVEGAGLVPALLGGPAAPHPDLAYRCARQEPPAGTPAARGDAVRVTLYGPFDEAAALAGVDCSPWPGTVPTLDPATGGARCACPAGTAWREPGGCAAVAAAPPPRDPCAELEAAFWQLLGAGRLDEARGALGQGRTCGFYADGVQAFQAELDRYCSWLNGNVLGACQAGDVAAAQQLLQQAQLAGCALSYDAYRCIDQVRQAERNQRTAEAWNAAMGMMNEIIRMQQQAGGGGGAPPSSGWTAPPVTGSVTPPPGVSGFVAPLGETPPGGGGPAPPSGGGGRSREDCERQYCPMCFNDVDLLSTSVDPQCNSCRQVNAANIQACMSGGAGGTAVATTATYRLACFPVRNAAGAVTGYGGCSCLGPSDMKAADAVILLQTRSWDQCKAAADGYGR